MEVVTDLLADVEVNSARLLEVQVLAADPSQPEVEAEKHHHRLHCDLLVGAQHCDQPLHGDYLSHLKLYTFSSCLVDGLSASH